MTRETQQNICKEIKGTKTITKRGAENRKKETLNTDKESDTQ